MDRNVTPQLAGWLLLLLLLSLPAPEARAAEGRNTWEERPDALDLRVGLGSPEGVLGASYNRMFTPHVSASLGSGIGLTGFHLVVPMLRLHAAWDHLLLGGGAGVSLGMLDYETQGRGLFEDDDTGDVETTTYEADYVAWASLELFLQYQTDEGPRLALGLGVTKVVAHGEPTSTEVYRNTPQSEEERKAAGPAPTDLPRELQWFMPYFWISVGKAF